MPIYESVAEKIGRDDVEFWKFNSLENEAAGLKYVGTPVLSLFWSSDPFVFAYYERDEISEDAIMNWVLE